MNALIALTVLAGVAALVRGVLRDRHELEQIATARLHQHVGRI